MKRECEKEPRTQILIWITRNTRVKRVQKLKNLYECPSVAMTKHFSENNKTSLTIVLFLYLKLKEMFSYRKPYDGAHVSLLPVILRINIQETMP